jgi:hypothetical protein
MRKVEGQYLNQVLLSIVYLGGAILTGKRDGNSYLQVSYLRVTEKKEY